ncbi:hypothetical protein SD961_04020 [Erwinia sp. MMLR14_017]|uniref:hypothetical protein n=1 Tax=Erwinia sp. MMLR14_017 TaxID=3093842 RepID=UPI00298FB11B|nr:hypothetical protein [Erwinia sp. MMLR14_017]MDW8845068.1 hypothetical protein [Erwinia sp. MMLR14_017]
MTEQYKMQRTQRVSFTKEEAEIIDQGREIASEFAPEPVSVNKFIRRSAELRAKKINEGDVNA